MKYKLFFGKILFSFTAIFLSFNFILIAQTIIPINSSFTHDTILLSKYAVPVYGLSADADITLNSDTGNIRIILVDIYENEYLVCDINALNSDSDKKTNIRNYCYESGYLNSTKIKNIKIEISDGLIYIHNFKVKTSLNRSFAKEQSDLNRQRNIENVMKINKYIKRNKYSCVADTTAFSKLPYS